MKPSLSIVPSSNKRRDRKRKNRTLFGLGHTEAPAARGARGHHQLGFPRSARSLCACVNSSVAPGFVSRVLMFVAVLCAAGCVVVPPLYRYSYDLQQGPAAAVAAATGERVCFRVGWRVVGARQHRTNTGFYSVRAVAVSQKTQTKFTADENSPKTTNRQGGLGVCVCVECFGMICMALVLLWVLPACVFRLVVVSIKTSRRRAKKNKNTPKNF